MENEKTVKSRLLFIKEHINGVRKSLRLRMALIMTMTIVVIILVFWLVNMLFLPSYYRYRKVSALVDTFDKMNKIFTEDVLDTFDAHEYTELEDIYSKVEQSAYTKGIDAYVFNIYSLGGVRSYVQLYYPMNASARQTDNLKEKFAAYNNESDVSDIFDINILESTDNYQVCRLSNKKNNANSIELLGTLDSGAIIMLTSNYDSIQESAYMSNTFLAYIGIIVSIIASVATFLISTRISRPILEISKIAERMADLDFEARYVVKENDEIAILGRSMNKLSDKLKQAISELKTANNELLKDIEVKEKNEIMRKELISNISHELKTPIALVQGYAEGLSENINDNDIESRQFYCEVIVDEAKKMNNIVMKILDLNNIESGNSQMTIERFDIVSLINTFVSSSEILFSQKEANVEFKNNEPIYVWADEFMTEEVLNNYVSNALNHIEGERKINIYVEVNDNIARVHVHNTGKNIPEEDIDKIWDKFYKVDKARTREYGGSGVGLSIVKAIMDSHGRKYGVDNKEDGVDFWFDLETK